MLNQEKIGKFIATLRKEEKNMTQEQFAEKLGVSNRSVSRWENGKSMPDLSMLPILSAELGVSVSELLNGERFEKEAEQKENISVIIELSNQEKKRKAKLVNQCFLGGLFCIGMVILHNQLGILGFAKSPNILISLLTVIGIACEIAGFYYNSQEQRYTDREIAVLSSGGSYAEMKTAGEMLQYAKRNQPVELKQYAKAFQAIEKELAEEETVVFSMVADSFIVNESWTDSWHPWHVALAVAERRLLICGEAIHGRFMTFYDVESYNLEDIFSAELVNRKIVIGFAKGELKIEGKNLETVIELLKNALKNDK